MKKAYTFLVTTIILAVFSCSSAFAHRFSLGVEGTLPMGTFGDGFNFGFGASARYEYPFGGHFGLTGSVGFLTFGGKDLPAGVDVRWNMIPILVGLKYYPVAVQQGFYGMFATGVTASTVSTEIGSSSNSSGTSDLTFSPGVGYHFDYIDLSLNYNIISGDGGSTGYLGLRVAYLFGHLESHH